MNRLLAIAAVLLTTTPSFAGVVIHCQDGTRNEPQAPTITEAFDTVKYTGSSPHPSYDRDDVCINKRGWRQPGFKADCMTLVDINSLAGQFGTKVHHPEVVTPNPDLIIATKTETVAYLRPPHIEKVTTDGSCH